MPKALVAAGRAPKESCLDCPNSVVHNIWNSYVKRVYRLGFRGLERKSLPCIHIRRSRRHCETCCTGDWKEHVQSYPNTYQTIYIRVESAEHILRIVRMAIITGLNPARHISNLV